MKELEPDAFVAALLAGDLSLDDPQVQKRLDQQPELRIMLQRMREVEEQLTRAAGEQREILAAARASPDREFMDRVRAAVQQVVVERRRSRRFKWAAAAAALLACLWLGWFVNRTPAAPDDMFLGSDEGLSPQGEVRHYSPFSWNGKPQPGGRFELRIFSVRDGGKGTLLCGPELGKVKSPCQLPAALEAGLPGEIYWEVEEFGGEPSIRHAHAWRR